jgi:hypothetical protein
LHAETFVILSKVKEDPKEYIFVMITVDGSLCNHLLAWIFIASHSKTRDVAADQ